MDFMLHDGGEGRQARTTGATRSVGAAVSGFQSGPQTLRGPKSSKLYAPALYVTQNENNTKQ